MKALFRRTILIVGSAATIGGTIAWIGRETGWSPLEAFARPPEFRSVVERIDLELDLRQPPRFVGTARMTLREGTQGRVSLLLNAALKPETVVDEQGRRLSWNDQGRLRSDYHREARVIAVDLPGPTRELVFEYQGRGEDEGSKRDWMGVLLVAPDELRMSKQTVFYPQIPLDIDGPDPEPWPARLRLLAPADLEAYVPGHEVECEEVPADGRVWCWESDAPSVLSLFAARRVRQETVLGDARVVTLLAEDHADLADAIADEAEQMLRFYAGQWGPIGARSLGIIEMKSRGDSYNWTSQGIIAMEAGALSGSVPVSTLAHEIAHLWWGQETGARGRGERFLTEGLAEYASWRYLELAEGEAAAESEMHEAEERWWARVHDTGVDPALFDVRFQDEGYTELAYAKGPVALWRLQQRIGREGMDAVLKGYRERAAGNGMHSADAFVGALRGVPAGAEVDLALFEQPGHAHLALEKVVFEGASARGRVTRIPCPAGIRGPDTLALTLEVYTDGAAIRQNVAPDASFEARAPARIQALVLDPEGVLPGLRAPPVLAPGIGFLSSEPPDGAEQVALGPLVVRLHFGQALAGPVDGLARRVQESSRLEARAAKTGFFSVRSATLEDEGRTLALELTDTSPATEHVLVLPQGLASARGYSLPGLQLRFRTRGAEGLPRPRIVATEPPDGARDVPASLARIEIVFSEPMRLGRGFRKPEVLKLEQQGAAYPKLGESRWKDPRTLVWDLAEPLERGKRYGLPFGWLYKSELGLELEPFDLCFETER